MTDTVETVVALPSSVTQAASSQKRATLALLTTIAQFAFSTKFTPGQLEMNLAAAFADRDTLTMSDITNWLSSLGVPLSSLSSIVGDLQTLHTSLQDENDAGSCQLLTVNRQDMLRVYTGENQEAILSQTVGPCYLLRVGYSKNLGYGLYYLSLPGLDGIQAKLTWNSVVAAGIADGLAIAPPKPPVDLDGAMVALTQLSGHLAAAHEAHLTALHALGLAE